MPDDRTALREEAVRLAEVMSYVTKDRPLTLTLEGANDIARVLRALATPEPAAPQDGVREAARVLLAAMPKEKPPVDDRLAWSRALSVTTFNLTYAVTQERSSPDSAWEAVRDVFAALAAPRPEGE